MTSKLPAEIMERIFRLLPPRTLRMVVLVCRRWRELGEDPLLWCQLCLTVNERNMLRNLLSSRRLQEVRKLIIKTPLTGKELQSVMRHPGLRELEISRCNAHGAKVVFSDLSENSQLKSLDISFNDLSSVEPGLLAVAIKRLETLNVQSGRLTTKQTESMFAAISEDSQLKSLNITSNDLYSVKPGLLARAVNILETLNMRYIGLTMQQTDSIFAAITEDSQLKSLDISINDLSSVEPRLLARAVKNLETQNVESGRLTTEQTESIFAAISEDSQLKSLDISKNDLSSVDPELLAKTIKILETLNVKCGRLTREQTESIFSAISEASQLKSLDISHNNLSSVEPRMLSRAVTMLESLDVRNGQLTTRQTNSIFAAIREVKKTKTTHILMD